LLPEEDKVLEKAELRDVLLDVKKVVDLDLEKAELKDVLLDVRKAVNLDLKKVFERVPDVMIVIGDVTADNDRLI